MKSIDGNSCKPAFHHGSIADWVADGISAIEELTRGRYALTSHHLLLALEALAMEVSNEIAQAAEASET